METKEYFEKVMQDFNQNRRGRNLRKYCSDEGIDYKWLAEYKKQYSSTKGKVEKEEVPLFALAGEVVFEEIFLNR